MNFCRNCGAKIQSPDDKFCSNCGAKILPDEPEVSTEENKVLEKTEVFEDVAETKDEIKEVIEDDDLLLEAFQRPASEKAAASAPDTVRTSVFTSIKTDGQNVIVPEPAKPVKQEPLRNETAWQPVSPQTIPENKQELPKQRMASATIPGTTDIFGEMRPAQTPPQQDTSDWDDLQGLINDTQPVQKGFEPSAGIAEENSVQPTGHPVQQNRQDDEPEGYLGHIHSVPHKAQRFENQANTEISGDMFETSAEDANMIEPDETVNLFETGVAEQQLPHYKSGTPPLHSAQTQEMPDLQEQEKLSDKVLKIQEASEAAETMDELRSNHQQPRNVSSNGLFSEEAGEQPRDDIFLMDEELREERYQPEPPKPKFPEKPSKRQRSQMQEADYSGKKSGGFGSRLVTIILGTVLAAAICFIAILGILFFLNRPAATVNKFVEAVENKDYSTLKKSSIVLNGIEPTDDGWAALCKAFETPQDLVKLKAELNGDADSVEGTAYSAVYVQEEDFLLFVKKHIITIDAVEAVATGVEDGTLLVLDSVEHTGEAVGGGVLYTGIMPGRYEYKLSLDGKSTTPAQIDLFSTEMPAVLEVGELSGGESGEGQQEEEQAQPTSADVTIENCLSDDAILYVSGTEASEKPLGNIVTIAAVPVGSEIKIVAKKDGKTYQSSVVFSDPATTALKFDNYAEIASESSSSSSSAQKASIASGDIDSVIGTFYKSYLDCINNQSLDALQLSTDTNKANVEKRVKTDANKSNTFTFVGAACDPESITETEKDGTKIVKVNATFQYNFKKRDDAAAKEEKGSNHQTITLVYVNDKWLVGGFSMISAEDFKNHKVG